MSEVPPSGQQPAEVRASSWWSIARQVWLGAVPVLLLAIVVAAGIYGWRAYQSSSAKARDRRIYGELLALIAQIQETRDNPSPDFGPIRAKAQAIGASTPEALKRDRRPGFLARHLLVCAARDDLPRLVQEDLSAISEAEVEFARKLVQAAEWMELSPPVFRTQLARVAEALAEIEQLGGVVTSDGSRPVQPVTAIEMKGDQFEDRHLEHLPGVKSLSVESAEVTDAGLQHIARIRTLTTLRLTCANVTDAGVASLAALPALSEVNLYDCSKITGNGLLAFKQARRLVLFGSHITDQTLTVLKEFPHLEHLTLRSDWLSDEGMGLVATLPGLTMLTLSHCHELSDGALLRIADLPNLESLAIEGVDLTDRGLEAVGRLPSLRWLVVVPCDRTMSGGLRITDAGLARMKNLTDLFGLEIQSCPGITDTSVNVLQGMSSLTQLRLNETGITEAGRLQIVSSHPQIRVDYVPTPPSPLDGTLTAGTEGDAPQDPGVPSYQGWPVPDPQAILGGTCTVDELEGEYRKSRVATDTKYVGKWIELSGPVSHVGKNLEGDPIIELRGSDRRFEIICVLRSASDLTDVVEGETCHLRGVYCSSVLPTFVHCTVNKSADGPPIDTVGNPAANGESNRRPPDVTLTAEQLDAEIAADDREAQRKYAGKSIQITGRLSRISHAIAGAMVYRLGATMDTQCFLRTGSPWYCARPGQTVTLVGRWFEIYPCLVDCEVIDVTGPPDRTMAATALGEYLESDPVQFRKWFNYKQLIVTGEVIEKSAPEGYPDQISITLRSTPKTTVVCKMEIDELRATESVQVGDSVTLTGRNIAGTPTDAIELVGCLFWRGK